MSIFLLYLIPVLAIFGWTFCTMQPRRPRPLRVEDLPLSIVPFDLRPRYVIAPSDSAVLACWPTNNLFGR